MASMGVANCAFFARSLSYFFTAAQGRVAGELKRAIFARVPPWPQFDARLLWLRAIASQTLVCNHRSGERSPTKNRTVHHFAAGMKRAMPTRLLKSIAKEAGYICGIAKLRVMRLPHNALTILMYHRILPAGDLRATTTVDMGSLLTDVVFSRSLDVIRRFYNVISVDEVLHYLGRRRPLPSRAALITFDDGWIDTIDIAAPELKRRGLSAVVFVPPTIFESHGPFWQERLATSIRSGRLALHRAVAMGVAAGGEPPRDSASSEAVITWLAAALTDIESERRGIILAAEPEALRGDDTRHFMTPADLLRLKAHGMSLGAHGLTHEALTTVKDPAYELAESRRRLSALWGSEILSMSFPHGRFNEHIVQLAYAAGYQALFSSQPVINQMPDLGCHRAVMGRITVGHGDGLAGSIADELIDRKMMGTRH